MKTIFFPDGEQTWFVVDDLDPALQNAARALGFKPTPIGGCGHYFASDTPHLELFYENFAASVETLILQKAHLLPVPWETALETFLARVSPHSINWWLTGSTSLAAQGVPIEPNDIDIVAQTVDDGILLDHVLQDVITEPARPGWIAKRVTRTFLQARVGWIAGVDEKNGEEVGLLEAGRSVIPIQWHGYNILVPPPSIQLRLNQRRGRTERVQDIQKWMEQQKQQQISTF